MGRPVKWLYSIVLEPGEFESKVALYRCQEGTDTRFLWAKVDTAGLIDLPGVDDVLQRFYGAVLALMESTA